MTTLKISLWLFVCLIELPSTRPVEFWIKNGVIGITSTSLRVTYEQAESLCTKTFDGKLLYNVWIDVILFSKDFKWIGLKRLKGETNFYWADNTVYDKKASKLQLDDQVLQQIATKDECVVMSGINEKVTHEIRDCKYFADGYRCMREWVNKCHSWDLTECSRARDGTCVETKTQYFMNPMNRAKDIPQGTICAESTSKEIRKAPCTSKSECQVCIYDQWSDWYPPCIPEEHCIEQFTITRVRNAWPANGIYPTCLKGLRNEKTLCRCNYSTSSVRKSTIVNGRSDDKLSVESVEQFPTWAIVVVCVCLSLAVVGLVLLIFVLMKSRKSKNKKVQNQTTSPSTGKLKGSQPSGAKKTVKDRTSKNKKVKSHTLSTSTVKLKRSQPAGAKKTVMKRRSKNKKVHNQTTSPSTGKLKGSQPLGAKKTMNERISKNKKVKSHTVSTSTVKLKRSQPAGAKKTVMRRRSKNKKVQSHIVSTNRGKKKGSQPAHTKKRHRKKSKLGPHARNEAQVPHKAKKRRKHRKK